MIEEVNQEKNLDKPKKSWKRIVLLILALCMVVVVAYAVWLFRHPATGVVRVIEPAPTQVQQEAILSPSRFDGRYVSFSYPSAYAPREAQTDAVSFEKGVFVATGSASRTIAFSVMDGRGKRLDDIPAYRLRDDVRKKEYVRENRSGENSLDAVVFTKQESGYEKTAFIIHKDIIMTLSVSSQTFADPERIEQDFEAVLSSIRFAD